MNAPLAAPLDLVSIADRFNKIRYLIEAARAATYDPERPRPEGMRALLDVIDERLIDLGVTIVPGFDE